MASTIKTNFIDRAARSIHWLGLRLKIERFRVDPWPKYLIWFQRGVLAAILIYLISKLTRMGWSTILSALPTSPWFYLLSVVMFFVPPYFEAKSYRLITGRIIPQGFIIFSKKRVYNEALVSYAGEAYLSDRLAKLDGYNYRKALIAVKDNNIISALVSNTWTIILIFIIILFGRSDVLITIWNLAPVLVGAFAVICLGVYGAVFVFLKRMTSLNSAKLIQIGFLHGAKIIVVALLQILQWASALPSETLQIWLVFLTLQILVRRIPGLPNADLVFLGVGLSLIGFADGPAADVTAMLVAATAMTQVIHLIVFIATTNSDARAKKTAVRE